MAGRAGEELGAQLGTRKIACVACLRCVEADMKIGWDLALRVGIYGHVADGGRHRYADDPAYEEEEAQRC